MVARVRYKGLSIFALILLMFLIPIWGAHWLYYKGSYLIKQTSNHGILVTPPLNLINLPLQNLQGQALDERPFKQQWTLLSVSTASNDYFKKLYTMRQIRLMLGKDMPKAQRVLLFYDTQTPLRLSQSSLAPYTGTLLYVVPKKDWQQKFTSTALSQNTLIFDGFFIIDPEGRLMMGYRSSTNPKYIMQDLHRLISERDRAYLQSICRSEKSRDSAKLLPNLRRIRSCI
jgi:hypothetical protein